MSQKTQTLIIFSNGEIAKRMDDFLYYPHGDTLILNYKEFLIGNIIDEFDSENWLVRKIYLKY